MPIDISYHAISLVAVFLAFALGILVGFSLMNPVEIAQFVEEVKKDNERTRQENRKELEDLRLLSKASQTFDRTLLPSVIENRLYGRRVAVIVDHDPSDHSLAVETRKVLEGAGAQVTTIISFRPQFAKLTQKQAAGILAHRQIVYPEEEDPRSYLCKRLGRGIVEGGSGIATYLENEGLIRLSSGSDLSLSAGSVVIIGGPTPKPEFLETFTEPMIQAIKEAQPSRRVVGCETRKCSGAAVQFFQQLDIPTVDCIDTYPGQAALVLTIAGADGNFGIKPNAERLMPDLE